MRSVLGQVCTVFICNRNNLTPSIVRVSCNSLSILVNDSNYVALKILDEVVGNIIVKNTTYGILVVVKGNKSILAPSLKENLGTVKSVSVLYATNCLARSDSVCIVGVLVVVKLLKLSPLFPSQSMPKIRGRVAVENIISCWAFFVKKNSALYMDIHKNAEKNQYFRYREISLFSIER